jgi:prevent-host-death family protein
MVEVGVLEAKTRLSELLDAAVRGEEIVISRHGRPLVRLARIVDDRPEDLEAHLVALRKRIARGDPPIPMSEAEIQTEWDELRGRT